MSKRVQRILAWCIVGPILITMLVAFLMVAWKATLVFIVACIALGAIGWALNEVTGMNDCPDPIEE